MWTTGVQGFDTLPSIKTFIWLRRRCQYCPCCPFACFIPPPGLLRPKFSWPFWCCWWSFPFPCWRCQRFSRRSTSLCSPVDALNCTKQPSGDGWMRLVYRIDLHPGEMLAPGCSKLVALSQQTVIDFEYISLSHSLGLRAQSSARDCCCHPRHSAGNGQWPAILGFSPWHWRYAAVSIYMLLVQAHTVHKYKGWPLVTYTCSWAKTLILGIRDRQGAGGPETPESTKYRT